MPKDSHKEGRLLLAIRAIRTDQIKFVWKAAQIYDVSKTTLCDHFQESIAQNDNSQHKCKLIFIEKNTLVQWILSMEKHEASLRLNIIWDMTNILLAN